MTGRTRLSLGTTPAWQAVEERAGLSNEQETRELVQKALGGNRGAFGVLVRPHLDGIWTSLRKYGCSPEMADDVVQDATLRAFERLAQFDLERGRFGPWLYRIALNRYLEEMRRAQTLRKRLEELEARMRAAQKPADRTKLDWLEEARESLNDEERTLLHLRFSEKLNSAEIAEVTGLTATNVRTRLHRVYEVLRGHYARYFPGEERRSG